MRAPAPGQSHAAGPAAGSEEAEVPEDEGPRVEDRGVRGEQDEEIDFNRAVQLLADKRAKGPAKPKATRKPAAKKPAVKKPAAKKPAVRKPAAPKATTE